MLRKRAIMVIAPYERFGQVLAQSIKRFAVKTKVVCDARAVGSELIGRPSEEVAAYISRGAIASRLKNVVDGKPVFEPTVTPWDILEALMKARTYGARAALIWVHPVPDVVVRAASLLGIELTVISPVRLENIPIAVADAKRRNVHVLIGGSTVGCEASKAQVPFVLLENSDLELRTFASEIEHTLGQEQYLNTELMHKALPERPLGFEEIVGQSEAITRAIELAQKYARTDYPILITGETGTGKELFARGIHKSSRRSSGPFVAVNCACIPDTLLESELFGYVEGAFTGSRKGGRQGLIAASNGGTLFLDEVSCLSQRAQSLLLRVLQEQEVRPLGTERVYSVDFRVIAATNQDLWELVLSGTFRMDLYYRLSALELNLPPLRERGSDVLVLLEHFLQRIAPGKRYSLTSEARDLLMRHDWPGNVRELFNLAERVTTLIEPGSIGPTVLLNLLRTSPSAQVNLQKTLSLRGIQDSAVLDTLRRCRGNVSEASRRLGCSRTHIYRVLRRTGTGPELLKGGGV